MEAHHGVLIVGVTGIGKTFVACALAQAAIRHGYTPLYLRSPRMLNDLTVARFGLQPLTTSRLPICSR